MAAKVKQCKQVLKGSHGGMQVVLLEDVPHLGKQGQVVEVRPGYGRNYLLPNGLAIIPTAHNLKLLERYKIRVQQAREARIADLKVLADQIQRELLVIEARATDEGHLYGSVGPNEISKALKAKNLMVEPEMVKVDPIKQVQIAEDGQLEVLEIPLHLGYEIETKVRLIINPLKGK